MSVSRIKVMFVCYGNICRSPIAEFSFKKLLEDEGLSDRFTVCSSGTSGDHLGESPDRRAVATLGMHGISCEGKHASRLLRSNYLDYDYIIGMDSRNIDYIRRMCPPEHVCEIGLLMDFAGGGEVADPYYTGDFERAYLDITRGCRGLLDHILEQHPELR